MLLFDVGRGVAERVAPTLTSDGGNGSPIQTIFEDSLHALLGTHFLASQYFTNYGDQIGTLAISDDGVPCVIEYAKGNGDNLVGRALSNARWIQENKEIFRTLCQQRVATIEIRWEEIRLICVAEHFSRFDIDTAESLPFNFELLRYKLFENNMLTIDTQSYPSSGNSNVLSNETSPKNLPKVDAVTSTNKIPARGIEATVAVHNHNPVVQKAAPVVWMAPDLNSIRKNKTKPEEKVLDQRVSDSDVANDDDAGNSSVGSLEFPISRNTSIQEAKHPSSKVTYSLNDHFARSRPQLVNIFKDLQRRILELDSRMELVVYRAFVAFKISSPVVGIVFQRDKLWVVLNVKCGKLRDPQGIAVDLVTPRVIGHNGKGDYRVPVLLGTDLDYLMDLVKQSYEFNCPR